MLKIMRRSMALLLCVWPVLLLPSSQALVDDHSHLELVITAEPENNRFRFAEVCVDCGKEFVDYEEAWAEFGGLEYGPDGVAHTLTVTPHLGEDVTMEARFGLEPEDMSFEEPPAVEGPGRHAVYYELTFTLWTESFTKSGQLWMIGPESEPEPEAPAPAAEENVPADSGEQL